MFYSDYLTQQQFILAKSREPVEVCCYCCGKHFFQLKHQIQNKAAKNYRVICSSTCRDAFRKKQIEIPCAQCSTLIVKLLNKKQKQYFCNHSCAAKYNNTHKTTGIKRSKLEHWLETNLSAKYPRLYFKFNSKEEIKSELDIFIPNLKLAFELNGIFHYEPIYGVNQLKNIQNNDTRKIQACLEQGIELYIIDTSQQKRFTEESSQKYLDIITRIIDPKYPSNNIR